MDGLSALELIIAGDRTLFAIVRLSLLVTLSATLLAAVVGMPIGAAVALTSFPARNVVIIVLNGFMGLPPVVVGLLVFLLLSRSGPLGPHTTASGQIWFTARHQTGVTVDAWGDGLLVVLDQPPSEKRPRGTTMITLTTYGLSETAFADLQSLWQGWWDERFETVAPGCD